MKIHEGVDIAAEYGSPVYATASGTVTQASYVEGYGNLVEIQHAENIVTRYGHNSIILVNAWTKSRKRKYNRTYRKHRIQHRPSLSLRSKNRRNCGKSDSVLTANTNLRVERLFFAVKQ